VSVFNLGSINIDHIFRLSHLPTAGETLISNGYQCGLGGKGANQSLALALAGAEVKHIGRLAASELPYLHLLQEAGVDLAYAATDAAATGSAVVMVDEQSAENQIVINPGANHQIPSSLIDEALASACAQDWALAQNETNNLSYFLSQAKAKGLRVCYSAAPFVAATTVEMLPLTDLLVVNQLEAEALASSLNCALVEIPVPHLVITLGAEGARYIGKEGDWTLPSPRVEAVDTTGAGDTFLGFMLAALTTGQPIKSAMQLALSAAALQVTRLGTAEAIPALSDVRAFMNSHNLTAN